MAITSTTYDAPATSRVGLAPSVYDGLILVGSDETPLVSTLGTSPVTNISHSWVIDHIGEPTRTAHSEVSNFETTTTSSQKQSTSNAVEIFKTELLISKTMTKVKAYGGSELEHETFKKGKEHKKLLELMILGLNRDTDAKKSVFKEPVIRTSTENGQAAGLFYYLAKSEKAFNATTGKQGNIFAHDSAKNWTGTATELNWEKLNTILQSIYDAGETPKDIFVGPTLKAKINTFVTRQYSNETTYTEKVTALETDFGTVNIKLSRFLSEKTGLADTLIAGNFEYAKVGLLYPTELADVATDKTAIAKRYYTEATLEVRNADAFAIGVGLK